MYSAGRQRRLCLLPLERWSTPGSQASSRGAASSARAVLEAYPQAILSFCEVSARLCGVLFAMCSKSNRQGHVELPLRCPDPGEIELAPKNLGFNATEVRIDDAILIPVADLLAAQTTVVIQ